MSAILTGLTSGGWALLVGWIFPSAIVAGLFGFFIFPSLSYLPLAQDITDSDPAAQALTLALAAVAIAILLNSIQIPLYRILEGYWPKSIWKGRTSKHIAKKHQLKDALEQEHGLERALLLEKYQRYPADDQQIAPTRLGNAIRSFEIYGYDRFRLDSQLLWAELAAVVPNSTSHAVDKARAGVDFFVSLIYLFVVLGAVSIVAGMLGRQDQIRLIGTGLVALALTPAWYQLAVVATDHWHTSVQALVNLGRKPLAEALGLHLPHNLNREREMWRWVNLLVREEFDSSIARHLEPHGSCGDYCESAHIDTQEDPAN